MPDSAQDVKTDIELGEKSVVFTISPEEDIVDQKMKASCSSWCRNHKRSVCAATSLCILIIIIIIVVVTATASTDDDDDSSSSYSTSSNSPSTYDNDDGDDVMYDDGDDVYPY